MYGNTTKIYSMMAVMALALAAFAGVVTFDAQDAADDKTLTVTYDGNIAPAEAKKMFAEGISVTYVAVLDDDYEDKITIINMDDFKSYVKPLIKAGFVEFELSMIDDNNDVTIDENTDKIDYDDFMSLLATFTSVEVTKLGDVIGGIETIIEVTGVAVEKDVEVISAEDAELAVELAVALALADKEAEIEQAVADAVAKYKRYISPEDAAKLVDEAIAEYKEMHPAKKDDTFLYVAIVLAAVIAALVGLMVYDKIVKPKMAKKATPPAI